MLSLPPCASRPANSVLLQWDLTLGFRVCLEKRACHTILGPHPDPLSQNLHSNKISKRSVCAAHLRSAGLDNGSRRQSGVTQRARGVGKLSCRKRCASGGVEDGGQTSQGWSSSRDSRGGGCCAWWPGWTRTPLPGSEQHGPPLSSIYTILRATSWHVLNTYHVSARSCQ